MSKFFEELEAQLHAAARAQTGEALPKYRAEPPETELAAVVGTSGPGGARSRRDRGRSGRRADRPGQPRSSCLSTRWPLYA